MKSKLGSLKRRIDIQAPVQGIQEAVDDLQKQKEKRDKELLDI